MLGAGPISLGGEAVDSRGEALIRSELETLADEGVPIATLDSSLKHHDLTGEEYDELWLYAWSLLEGRAANVVVGAAEEQWYGYSPVEGG
jgi:hypothetical protein